MAIGDEIRKSFQADSATFSAGIQARQVGGQDVTALQSSWTNKKKAKPTNGAGAYLAVTTATSADISATGITDALDIGNSIYVLVEVELTTSTGSITIAMAKYDTTGAYLGLTSSWTFTAQGTLRNGAAGKYVCEGQPFDVGNASKVRPVIYSISDSSADIFVSVL